MANMTPDELKDAKFRGPVAFYDGRNGMARQDFECIAEPRFSYAWQRENRQDKGRQYYMVDGREVTDFEEAARLLALPADADSPREQYRREMVEFKASPVVGGATRALSEARCNADAGPFAMVRAWMHRAENAWHVGMNRLADLERKAGQEHPAWLYRVKSAAHEAYRLMYLFESDRKNDTGLRCAIGVRCRDCTILQEIESAMIESRARKPFPSEIEDHDIYAAKVWTCLGHILTEGTYVLDGAFLTTRQDRESYL